jgi:hypothetical protein
MSLLLDRNRRAGRYLEWKVRIFAAGAVLGLAGIFLDSAWMRLGAIVVLASGMMLRFLPGGRTRTAGPEEDDEQDADDRDTPAP